MFVAVTALFSQTSSISQIGRRDAARSFDMYGQAATTTRQQQLRELDSLLNLSLISRDEHSNIHKKIQSDKGLWLPAATQAIDPPRRVHHPAKQAERLRQHRQMGFMVTCRFLFAPHWHEDQK